MKANTELLIKELRKLEGIQERAWNRATDVRNGRIVIKCDEDTLGYLERSETRANATREDVQSLRRQSLPVQSRYIASSLWSRLGLESKAIEHFVANRSFAYTADDIITDDITPGRSYTCDTLLHTPYMPPTLYTREHVEKALVRAYHRVPREYREDILHSLYVRTLEKPPTYAHTVTTICKTYVDDWWRAYAYRQHYSLDLATDLEDVEDQEARALWHTLNAHLAYLERNDPIIHDSLFAGLPSIIRDIVAKQSAHKKLNGYEATIKRGFIRSQSGKSLLASLL